MAKVTPVTPKVGEKWITHSNRLLVITQIWEADYDNVIGRGDTYDLFKTSFKDRLFSGQFTRGYLLQRMTPADNPEYFL